MAPRKINLANKFALFEERWRPKLVGEFNGQGLKLAKLEGAFVWHKHDDADEVFLVVEGSLTMRFRDGEEHLEAGELIVVPRGVEHLPVAEKVAHVLLIEPTDLLNTGDAPAGALTAERIEEI